MRSRRDTGLGRLARVGEQLAGGDLRGLLSVLSIVATVLMLMPCSSETGEERRGWASGEWLVCVRMRVREGCDFFVEDERSCLARVHARLCRDEDPGHRRHPTFHTPALACSRLHVQFISLQTPNFPSLPETHTTYFQLYNN
ncbi:hypothetical protein CC80DRAFT_176996 [Byssothecium circinans]|uniref:Uncharacterized protein n=1 Tax=Byssothecium circinans TaxID=147558 RepID=A0A6A5TKZ5_9PLEO|nr:hypothetical protein CC80DRAFT_176996 [Byssothecium circinans]